MNSPRAAPTDDKGPTILIVLWTLTGLTTVLVTARIYIRAGLLHNLGVDDWVIALSLLMGVVYCILTTINVQLGFGKHAWLLSTTAIETATFLNCLSFLFGIISFTLPKLAVTAMLNRILNASHIQRVCLWALSTLTTIVSGVCIIFLFTMCDPPRALWQTRLAIEGKATCKNVWLLIDYAIFTGALSGFVDLVLAIYPSTVLMKLHMSLRKRLALCAALGLGSVASAMAIIKCTQLKSLADQEDYTYGTADLIIWTNIESNIVIIASCIPTLQPFLELLLGNRTASSYSNSRKRNKCGSSFPDDSHDSRSKGAKAQKRNLTIATVESQEHIIPNHDGDQRLKESHMLGMIRRTDNVTVEFEQRQVENEVARSLTAW
ncbi:uncharacterized protein BO97DRAFT_472830 [Aspergillus homomorphus CBS 101889]|uniref:Rhodopsin domain-containing protein n=1 Tax=Aspergillus homomorphus (strain CBS 101889) TaxID=1450537 RepID=A0A395HMJ5_ASPHC|nr:hypothetical protein BO97DRAFT_472830 [Aspergillus homomorphus CBS 101889]RAL08719.1 hypothetical protein BO97DRAFT_472830 [Aspergillus homomorphus CBS 101889]